MPSEMLPSAIVPPSLASHLMETSARHAAVRIEDTLRREGVLIDRGTLSRIKKLVGDALAPTVVKRMLDHGRKIAFCISTATVTANASRHRRSGIAAKRRSATALVSHAGRRR
jgi:hypothetical protein